MAHNLPQYFTLGANSRLGGVFRLVVWNCFLFFGLFFLVGFFSLQTAFAVDSFATTLDNKPANFDQYDCHVKFRGQFAQYQGLSGVYDWYIQFDNPSNQNRLMRTGIAKDGSAVITFNSGSSTYSRYYWYNNQWTAYTGTYQTALDTSVRLAEPPANILSDCNLYGYSSYTYTGGFHGVGNPYTITISTMVFLANSDFQLIPTIEGLDNHFGIVQYLVNGEIDVQEILTSSEDMWILVTYPNNGAEQQYNFISKYPTKYLQVNYATGLSDDVIAYSATEVILDTTIIGLWDTNDICAYIWSETQDINIYNEDFQYVGFCPLTSLPNFPDYVPDFPVYEAPVDDWGTFNFLKDPLESLSMSLYQLGDAIVNGVIEAIKFVFVDLLFDFDNLPPLFEQFRDLFLDRVKYLINYDLFTFAYNVNAVTPQPIYVTFWGFNAKIVDFSMMSAFLPYIQPILIAGIVVLVSRINFVLFKRLTL